MEVAETGTVSHADVPVEEAPLYVVDAHVLAVAIVTEPVDCPPITPVKYCPYP